MATKARFLMAAAALTTAMSGAVPAAADTASAAISPCRATTASTGSEVAVALNGHYVDTKTQGNVVLTCHIVQNGVRVASTTDSLFGPVAVLASDQRMNLSPFTVCYEITIHEIVQITWTRQYLTNC